MKNLSKLFAVAAASVLPLTVGCTGAGDAQQQPTGGASQSSVSVVNVSADPETVVDQKRITVGASLKAVQAAMAKCQADKLPFVTIALVDRFGTLQALLRGDNAAQHTIESARKKAYTAAALGAPTSELAKRITGPGPSIADLPDTMFLPGGVPLMVDGMPIAGIGVGGAPDGTRDEACAAAGAEAIAEQ